MQNLVCFSFSAFIPFTLTPLSSSTLRIPFCILLMSPCTEPLRSKLCLSYEVVFHYLLRSSSPRSAHPRVSSYVMASFTGVVPVTFIPLSISWLYWIVFFFASLNPVLLAANALLPLFKIWQKCFLKPLVEYCVSSPRLLTQLIIKQSCDQILFVN